MKTIPVILFFTIVPCLLFAQQQSIPEDVLLQKSKKQKKAAFITLGCGVAAIVPGIILLSNEQPGIDRVNWGNVFGGTGLLIVGAGCLTTSIVLFSASKKNERKANAVVLHLNKPVLVNTGLQERYLPYSAGISVTIR